jgi:translocation and assembly module TamB
MRRAPKIAAWIAGGVLLLIAVVVVGVFIVGNTQSGRAMVIRLTPRITQGHVQLAGIHGSFPAALDLDRLELHDADGVWLYADHISLRWSPAALLVRHVKVDTLHISRLHVERAPLPEKPEKPSSSSSIPHSDLANLSIDTLELGEKLAGQPTALTVRASAHLNSLEDATAHVTARRTGGNGDYQLHLQFDPVRIEASLQLQEPANGPLENLLKIPDLGALWLSAKVSGPRTAEKIDITMNAGPLRGRAQGAVNLVASSADLDYLLTAPEMTPAPGLTWQRVDLQGRFHGPFKTPQAVGHLLVKELQVPGGTQLSALDANLTANAGWMSLRATIDGLVIPGPQPKLLQNAPLSVAATVRLNDDKRPVELTANHKLFALNATAVTAGEQSARLNLRLPDLAPLAAVAGQKLRGGADLRAHITRDNSTIHLIAEANGNIDGGKAAWAGLLRGGTTRVQLDTLVTDEAITLDRLQLNGHAISLSARGTAGRTDAQKINARLDLKLPDLSRVSPTLVGTAELSTKLKGLATALSSDTELTSKLSIRGSPNGTISASLHAEDLPKTPHGTIAAHGDLDGAPLQLNVSLEYGSGDIYHVILQHVDWKSAHAQGDITSSAAIARAKGNARFRMDQLSDLNRLLGSTLQGSVSGSLALVPVSGKSRAQLQFEAKDVNAGGMTTNAQLHAAGTLDALDIQLAAQSPAVGGAPASVDSNARLNMTAHELQLAKLDAQYHGQDIHLVSPAKISFGDGLAVQDLKIGAQEALLAVDGRVSPALDLHASLKQLKPELINAFVPDLLASGTIQADLQVQGRPNAPTGQVSFDATGIRAKNAAAQGLPATDLHANAQLMGNTAKIDANLTAGSASHVTLTGRAPLAADGVLDAKLAGNLDTALLNPLLEAKGRHVTGAIAVDTHVTGAAANPEIDGTVRLTKGSFRDYTQGISLTDITGDLSGSHGQLKIEKLTARAAPGNLSVEGTVGVLQPKIPVSLKLTAKNAQPIASNILTANLDANLEVTGTARERLDVGGTVRLNRADVGIPSGLPPNVAVLNVEEPGKAPPAPSGKPLVIGLNITMDAPRQILVKGRGLDAEMGGQLRIQGTTDEPQVTGGFDLLRGFFTLANSKLTFSNGNVTFSGAGLKNRIVPTLDFTAASHVAEITATVHITGLADAPKIELSSTPELPQDEILARLLFGESASQLTAMQLLQTGAALASLGGGGGDSGFNPVAKTQKALGLDRLSVGGGGSSGGAQGTQSTGPTVEAGKYVSSRVFVGVKQSTTGASQIAVDVDLTKNVKLLAKLGNGQTTAQGTTPENDPGSSLGVAYQFEY